MNDKSSRGGAREGAGRKPINSVAMSSPISIRLPVTVLEAIDKQAQELHTTRSRLIIHILSGVKISDVGMKI